MNDRQLVSFIKIVETGSFSKAAKDSFISVPAMVQQIDRLEETLGFRLFLRSNQGVMLTGSGRIFYDAVLEMQKTYEAALKQIKSGGQDEIYIGVALNQCPEFLMNGCSTFQKKFPQTILHLKELPYEQHLDWIRQGKIDLTVIAKPTAWMGWCMRRFVRIPVLLGSMKNLRWRRKIRFSFRIWMVGWFYAEATSIWKYRLKKC